MITIEKDLRPQFGGVRDQGPRPTCLAFATSDAHAALLSPFRELSVDYLFYYAVQQMPGKNPHHGVSLPATADALLRHGQPHEATWPYSSSLPANLSNWVPPSNCRVLTRSLEFEVKKFNDIKNLLANDRPVVVILNLNDGFYVPDADGTVPEIDPRSFTGSHAVVAVGHGKVRGVPSLMIRNSWGNAWGLSGHAHLLKDYVDRRTTMISTIH
jgi:hypothetical protein